MPVFSFALATRKASRTSQTVFLPSHLLVVSNGHLYSVSVTHLLFVRSFDQ